jgi:hypothetical protein
LATSWPRSFSLMGLALGMRVLSVAAIRSKFRVPKSEMEF